MPEAAIALASARDLDPARLIEFASAAWPDDPPEKILSRWWLTSDFAEALTALDQSGRITALCVGVPSRWQLPDGEMARAISICGWYVNPANAGQGLGQALVRAHEAKAPYLNTLSISQAAVRSFAKLGWVGPYIARLRLLPVPALRRRPRADSGITLKSFEASAGDLPADLAQALDAINGGKPPEQLRRERTADEWRARLAVRPNRRYRFHIVEAEGEPVGYFAVRPTDVEAGRQYRLARLHYVSDIVFNRDEPGLLRQAFAQLAGAVPATAGALLLCTSSDRIAEAASSAGWLDEQSPVIGARLRDKAPLYMLGGSFVPLAGADVRLTFADSDVDLNI